MNAHNWFVLNKYKVTYGWQCLSSPYQNTWIMRIKLNIWETSSVNGEFHNLRKSRQLSKAIYIIGINQEWGLSLSCYVW